MPNKILKIPKCLLISIILALGLFLSLQPIIAAWSPPSVAPPDGNVEEPINKSTGTQIKAGSFGIGGGFSVLGNSAFTGNVGIGTTTPDTQLNLYNNTSGPIVSLQGINTSYRGLKIADIANTEKWFVGSNDINNFVVRRDNGTDDIIINSSGNVGIGTTDPGQTLTVAGEIRGRKLTIGAGEVYQNTGAIYHNDDYLEISTARVSNSGDIILSPFGNVGIGTTDPGSDKLKVAGNIHATGTICTDEGCLGVIGLWDQGVGDNIYKVDGIVGIGTDNPQYGKLHVNGGDVVIQGGGLWQPGGTSEQLYWRGRIEGGGEDNNYASIRIKRQNGPIATDLAQFYIDNQVTPALIIEGSGNIGIGIASPEKLLHLYKKSDSENAEININSKYANDVGSSKWSIYQEKSDGNLRFWNDDVTGEKNVLSIGNDGFVGIGTTNPGYKLDVAGQIRTTTELCAGSFCGNNYAGRILVTGATGELSFMDRGQNDYSDPDTAGNRWVWYSTGNVARFWSGSDKMAITSSGNVGIGDVSPDGTLMLDVEGQVGATEYCDQNGSNCTLATDLGGSNLWNSNAVGIDYMANNVGIGTTSPSSKLNVSGDANTQILVDGTTASNNAFFINGSGQAEVGYGPTGYGGTHPTGGYLHANNGISFGDYGGANYMWIDTTNGNVGIGITNPDSQLYLYKNDASTNAEIAIQSGDGYTVQNKWSIYNAGTDGTGSLRFWNTSAPGGGNALTILDNGNIGVGYTNPSSPFEIVRNGEAYDLGISSNNPYYTKGVMATLVANNNGVDSAALIDLNAYNATAGATNIFFGAVAGSTGNGPANFVIGRRTGTQSWAESLRVDTSGNVGIGTDNPSANLHVEGGGYDSPQLILSSSSGAAIRLRDYGSGDHQDVWLRNDGTNFTVEGDDTHLVVEGVGGNVGIGTTNPLFKLAIRQLDGTYDGSSQVLRLEHELSSGTAANNIGVGMQFAAENNAGNTVSLARIYGSASDVTAGSEDGYLSFLTTDNGIATGEKMRITHDGKVGIGITNPGAYKLNVNGSVYVLNDLTIDGQLNVSGADLAEEFSTDGYVEAGTVMVMDDGWYKSSRPCDSEYDKKAIGVVSDNASVIMGRIESENKAVIALTGVVKVKVINNNGIIKKGDLLTTSSVTGHAMKAVEPKIGTVIGKALEDFNGRRGEIMAFINLQ